MVAGLTHWRELQERHRTVSAESVPPRPTAFECAAVRSVDGWASRSYPGHVQPFAFTHRDTATARRFRSAGSIAARDDGDRRARRFRVLHSSQWVRPSTRFSQPQVPHFFGARGICSSERLAYRVTLYYLGPMSRTVNPAKFVTCICGKVCKGKSAHQTHARACEQEQQRSAAFIDAVERGDWTAYSTAYAGTRYVR